MRPSVTLDLDVALTHLRVAETGRHAIELEGDGEPLIAFPADGGGSPYLPGMEPLSEVLARFNEAYGGTMSDADRLNIDGLGARMVDDALLQAQAVANTEASFAQVFEDRFGEFVAGHLKGNEGLLIRLLDEPDNVARLHVEPSAFPVIQEVKGVPTLWVRLDAGTRAVTDPAEIDRYIATRWPGAATPA